MRKVLALSFFALASFGCGNPVQISNAPVQNQNNTLTVTSRSQNSPVNPANTNQATATKPEAKTKWTQSGEPIDTGKLDAEIKQAEKNLKSKPNDATAKTVLSEAYLNRGFALTEAHQYASALGDYRRALKLDPNNADAKTWIDKIIDIYDGLNKEFPKEGEEPPPLPFNKKT